MPTTQSIAVKKLTLDARNFRTLEQPDEISAIHALIDVSSEWFWAVLESLIDDGYLPNENIIALVEGRRTIVKEGNRRIAAMKIIHGMVPVEEFSPPPHIAAKLSSLPANWKKANMEVPCTIYSAHESDIADRIVALTHGKGEKAGRLTWSAVARARHNREKSGSREPALDLLEKYLTKGKNLSPSQAARWAGDYPLTVLDEAMKRLATRLGVKTGPDVAKAYPKIAGREKLEDLMLNIGLKSIKFADVRNASFGEKQGFMPDEQFQSGSKNEHGDEKSSRGGSSKSSSESSDERSDKNGDSTSTQTPKRASNAHPANDPKSVSALLRDFKPKGKGREKLATLLDELRQINVMNTPHAFCFVLRSMFEVSGKAYCADHASKDGLKAVEADGRDRKLIDVLKDVVKHLTNGRADKAMERELHGAITELANPTGVLSVTSLNQLVHNPKYVINGANVCGLFANVFPLLKEMNK